jgi:hypothetical protein
MNEVPRKLMAFLDRSARYPFQWGRHDCMLDIADWLDYACGLRVAAAWRNVYASEAEIGAMLAPAGGFEAAMRAEATRLGLAEAREPLPGDVALVTVAGQDKPLGAILTPSGKWRMRTLKGFVVTKAVDVVVAWSLPCRPFSRLR